VKRFQEAVFDSPPALKEGVIEALEFLATDYNLGIISDTGITPGRLIRLVLEDHDIIDYFDAILFSDEIGVCKPHLDIFTSAQRALESRPNSSLHIGDLIQTDIIGAKNAGWKAVWVKTEEYYIIEGSVPKFMELWLQTEPGAAVEEIQPDYTINSLIELMKLPLFKSEA
jgi:HAD superfamily hydrolase (TIGR01549 family)